MQIKSICDPLYRLAFLCWDERSGRLSGNWGRLGNDSGQTDTAFYASRHDTLSACDVVKAAKIRRGYVAQAEQLDLPLWG